MPARTYLRRFGDGDPDLPDSNGSRLLEATSVEPLDSTPSVLVLTESELQPGQSHFDRPRADHSKMGVACGRLYGGIGEQNSRAGAGKGRR